MDFSELEKKLDDFKFSDEELAEAKKHKCLDNDTAIYMLISAKYKNVTKEMLSIAQKKSKEFNALLQPLKRRGRTIFDVAKILKMLGDNLLTYKDLGIEEE